MEWVDGFWESPEILQSIIERISKVKFLESFWSTPLTVIKIPVTETQLRDTEIEMYRSLFWSYDEELNNISQKNVWVNITQEIQMTYKFLWDIFKKSERKLTQYWVSPEELQNACTQRIIEQVLEAWKTGRKLINGKVASLVRYENNTLYLGEVPYYAFACTWVSLDTVKVWERTLREIVKLCDGKTDAGDFMIPNSLWICVTVLAKNNNGKPIIIGQVRNNTTTLTQRDSQKVVASASGAISLEREAENILSGAASDEIEEELWLSASEMTEIFIKRKISTILWWDAALWNNAWSTFQRELGIASQSAFFRPSCLVIEERRLNPEIICHAVETDMTLEEIQSSWENAQDKDESLAIKWITFKEIQQNLNWEITTLDPHFIMSLLGWGNDLIFLKPSENTLA